MNNVLEVLKSRRSIRAFLETQIKDEEVEAIVEAGLYAPSAKNAQPWHFTVVQNKELIDEMSVEIKENLKNSPIEFFKALGNDEKYHAFYNAPTVVIVCGQEAVPSVNADCSAAIQNMQIAAESLNIGSCWMGPTKFLFAGNKAKHYLDKLEIPEGYACQYSIVLGHKKMEPTAPPRKENTVNYIK